MSDTDATPETPSNADLMKSLRAIAAGQEKHERRISVLEADRAIVHRLAKHVADMSLEVTVIHELLAKSEDQVAGALRLAGREVSSQVTAAVRAELSGMRGEVQELAGMMRALPCVAGAECPEGEVAALRPKEVEGA